MNKTIVFLLVTSIIALIVGLVLLFLPIQPTTTYLYSGNIYLSNDQELTEFKKELAEKAIESIDGHVTIINSHNDTVVSLDKLNATEDFSYGICKEKTQEAEWSFITQTMCLVYPGIVILALFPLFLW